MSRTAEKIAIMQAAERGEKVEWVRVPETDWKIGENPCWDWVTFDYRIKPREPLEGWVNVYDLIAGDVIYPSKALAEARAMSQARVAVHMREVIEDKP